MFRRSKPRLKREFRPALDRMERITLLSAVPIVAPMTQAGAFTVNGNAAVTSGGVRMTNGFWQDSSVWFNQLESPSNYTATFTFSLAGPHGGSGWADGFTFAVANAATTSSKAIGAVGGGIGYEGLSGYAIEFNTYYNAVYHDPHYVDVGLDLGGSVVSSAVSQPLPFNIEGAGPVLVKIVDNANKITVSIAKAPISASVAPTYYQVLSASVPSKYVAASERIGFTAATGAGEETATLSNFHYLPTTTPVAAANPSLLTTADASDVTIVGNGKVQRKSIS
jgi:hypothetical protein